MAKKILWGSIALAPVTIFVHYAFHPGGFAEFVLAAAALIPLARRQSRPLTTRARASAASSTRPSATPRS